MVVLVLAGSSTACGGDGGDAGGPGNVVVILTDDQTLASLQEMDQTLALLGAEGTTFDTAIATLPLCCPARATLLTGQLAHNHGVEQNVPPLGGVRAFDPRETLAVWLQEAGYQTSHVGKYLNGYAEGIPASVPPGWDRWFGLIDPTTYRYTGFSAFDGTTVQTFPDDPASYQTTVLADRAVAEVEAFVAEDEPFYLEVATLGPHAAQPEGLDAGRIFADLAGAVERILPYAPGEEQQVAELTAPRTPNVLESDLATKPAWVQQISATTDALVEALGVQDQAGALLDEYYRRYISNVLALDDAVARIVGALEAQGVLDDTLVLFTSDNGMLFGEHGLLLRKVVGYEESIRVPLLVRGAGFDAGAHVAAPVGNVDVAGTVLEWTGAEPSLPQDGRSLLAATEASDATEGRVVPVSGTPDGNAGAPAYRGVRTQRWAYLEHETGERELYDVLTDPYQLANLAADPNHAPVVERLAQAALTLATCAGADCVLSIPPDQLAPPT
jgi:arylsulfatase A-like enzyme